MKWYELKEILKKEAKALTALKAEIKEKMRNGEDTWREQGNLYSNKYTWRHKHIAYCLLKGRTYEQIERKCGEDNKPNQRLIDKYKEEVTND